VAAGSFPDFATGLRYEELCQQHPAALRYAGPVQGAEKTALFRTSHALCLPTRYPAEGQPLVLLEALAHDLPVIASRWRAIPDTLPPESTLVEPDDADALTAAVRALAHTPPPAGKLRRHFLAHYTTTAHLSALHAALASGDHPRA
jgi:glycosyltransferase involved in cell wall biosynthesis